MILEFKAERKFTNNQFLPLYFISEEAEAPAYPKP